jgi:hypothetical protein
LKKRTKKLLFPAVRGVPSVSGRGQGQSRKSFLVLFFKKEPLLFLLSLTSCSTSCPLPRQQRMTETRLYFGRDIQGGGFVTDAAWGQFAAQTLTQAFPDGFTITAGVGQWRNPRTGQVTREKSFIVEIDGELSPARIARVTQVYRQQFRQDSVGVVTQPVCGAF